MYRESFCGGLTLHIVLKVNADKGLQFFSS